MKKRLAPESGINIRYRPSRPNSPYLIDVYRKGRRYRQHFQTEEEARAAAIELAGKIETAGTDALNLSRREFLDATEALALLDGRTSLVEAARAWIAMNGGDGSATVEEVVAALIETKKAAGRRPATVKDIAFRTRALLKEFGSRPIASVVTPELEKWLAGLKCGQQSRENYRRVISGVFSFAVKRGLSTRNPMESIERIYIDEKLPEFLRAATAERLLKTAKKKHPEMVPYFAIGLFAGLRPENELAGLQWEDVNLDDNLILVRPNTAKKRRSRLVEIAGNLHKWLEAQPNRKGKVKFSRESFSEVVKEAKVTWTPDIMRHTFATFHLAKNNDAAKTALQMGHTGGVDVLFNHYRGLAKAAEAEKFWAIAP